MAETPATDSLAQRLVVDRLAAPGMLDRHSVEHAHERFSRPASSHDMGRLHRRIAPASPSSGSLPLVRVDRYAEPGAISPTRSSNEVAAPADGLAPVPRQANSGAERSFVGALVARQTPTIARTSEFVARRVAEAPGLVGVARTSSRLLERASHADGASTAAVPAIASSVVAAPLAQRVAEPRESASAAAIAASVPPTTLATSPMVMRTATPMPVASTPPHADVSRESATTSAAPQMSPTSNARASTPLLWRKADAASPAVSALPLAAALPSSSAASSALLLRKPDSQMARTQHATQVPSIAPAPTSVIARTAATAPHAPPSRGAWTATSDLNIDWIAEQVGNRLARRLEIERERMGVRQWRQ